MQTLTIIASLIIEVDFRDRNGVLQGKNVRNLLAFDAAVDFECRDWLFAGHERLGADFELYVASLSREWSDKESIAYNFTSSSDGVTVIAFAMIDETGRQQQAVRVASLLIKK